MSRPIDRAPMLAMVVSAAGAAILHPSAARGQSPTQAPPTNVELPAIEEYLRERNLRSLLIPYLLHQLEQSEPAARGPIAERLGELFGDALETAKTADERAYWEQQSERLLALVPESLSYNLRLKLTKVRYLEAEALAESWRLRRLDKDQTAQAEASIKACVVIFNEVGAKVQREVESLERRELQPRDEDPLAIKRDLDAARSTRSLAMYYAGWAGYYQALLSGSNAHIPDALKNLGWLLNAAGGREANLERVQPRMLRYSHVARAAIACALCESLRGNHDTAIRWMEFVEQAEALAGEVKVQLPFYKAVVFAKAKRWADLQIVMKGARAGGSTTPNAIHARLAEFVAFETLGAVEAPDTPRVAQEVVRKLADEAIADLIAAGEGARVLELARRYGLSSLPGDGFIVAYVRGLIAFDKAEAQQIAAKESIDEPSRTPAIINAYREAALVLDGAMKAGDIGRFARERGDLLSMSAAAWFRAGEFGPAADRFEQAAAAFQDTDRGNDALWRAVLTLHKGVEQGQVSLRDRRNSLAQLYIRTYPRGERSASLYLLIAGSSSMAPEQALSILLEVDRSSKLYEPCRRQAAAILLEMLRKQAGPAKDASITRFVELSMELLAIDQQTAATGTGEAKRKAAASFLVLARQTLEALLALTPPDAGRADRVLAMIDQLDQVTKLDFTEEAHADITLRKLEVALALQQTERADRALEQLRQMGGRYASIADQRLYRDAARAWAAKPADLELAKRVTDNGVRVIKQVGSTPDAMVKPGVASLHNTVASAAAALWRANKDNVMLQLALSLDDAILAAHTPTASLLKRHAQLSEAAGQTSAALEMWERLMAALPPGGDDWFEARIESLRLLQLTDPTAARRAFEQHKILFPNLGPGAWADKMRAVEATLHPGAGGTAPTPPPPTGGPQ